MLTDHRVHPYRLFSRCAPLRACMALALALAAGLLLAGGTYAATFEDLYTVRVAAEPEASRSQIEAAAMSTLLTRVTGRRDAPFDPRLAPLISRAGNFINSFGLMLDRERYEVQFNATAVQRELTNLQYPVWGPERPLTLVWIAVDGGLGEREILAAGPSVMERSPELAEQMAQLRAALMTTADQRGLPLAFPLMDLEDLIAVDFADVWGGFGERLTEASQRYQADALLIGRAWAGDFGMEVQWTLYQNGQRHFINGNGMRDGLDFAADRYAGAFSTVGGVRTATLVVQGVTSLADYGRVMHYLEGSSLLDAVDMEAWERGTLRLRVHARGDAATLQRVLSLGGVLSPAGAGGSAGGDALLFEVSRRAGGG
jgi:uncharacterized protein